MFQLDENFLKDLGLGDLPQEEKTAFLQYVYDQLELRVGTRLAEGLSDAQMGEFESLIDRDETKVREWLANNMPQYEQAPDFKALVDQVGADRANDIAVLSEYAATKWLELNRPDYRNVVAEVLDQLKQEIIANREHILGGQN